MGVEVELDDRVTYHRYYYDLFYKQLDKGHALDFDGNITNAYYAGSRTVKNIRLSTVPEVREIYDDLYQWIKGTYMPLKTD